MTSIRDGSSVVLTFSHCRWSYFSSFPFLCCCRYCYKCQPFQLSPLFDDRIGKLESLQTNKTSMSCSIDRVSYEQNGRGNDLPSNLLVFSRWFTVRRQHCIANYRTKTAKVIQTGACPKHALFTIKLSMKLSWSQASGLLATSYSISQSKKLYFSLGFRFSEISAVPFVLWSANQKNRFFPLSQSLYWRPPADQKASGLWVRDWLQPETLVRLTILE